MHARVEPGVTDTSHLDNLSDAELVHRYRYGTDAALELLLRRHSDGLYRFCCHLVSSREDAEDICQETIARAITRVDSLQTGASFKGWLYTIARNQAMDSFRGRKRVCALPDEEITPLPVYEDGPHDRVEIREEHQTVAEALGKLAKSHQQVLMLREVEGLSYAAIAQQLDVSQSAVETLLFRARRRLKEEYGKRIAAPAIAAISGLRGIVLRLGTPVAGAPIAAKVAVTGLILCAGAIAAPHLSPVVWSASPHHSASPSSSHALSSVDATSGYVTRTSAALSRRHRFHRVTIANGGGAVTNSHQGAGPRATVSTRKSAGARSIRTSHTRAGKPVRRRSGRASSRIPSRTRAESRSMMRGVQAPRPTVPTQSAGGAPGGSSSDAPASRTAARTSGSSSTDVVVASGSSGTQSHNGTDARTGGHGGTRAGTGTGSSNAPISGSTSGSTGQKAAGSGQASGGQGSGSPGATPGPVQSTMSGATSQAQGGTNGASGQVQGVTNTAGGTAQSATSGAQATVTAVTGQANGAASQTQAAANNSVGAVQGTANSTGGTVQGAVGGASGQAQSTGANTTNQAKGAATATTNAAAGATNNTSGQGQGTVGKTGNDAKGAGNNTGGQVKGAAGKTGGLPVPTPGLKKP